MKNYVSKCNFNTFTYTYVRENYYITKAERERNVYKTSVAKEKITRE